jgi:hypothetical protein
LSGSHRAPSSSRSMIWSAIMRSPLAADRPQREPSGSIHSHCQPARRQTISRQALCSGVRSSRSATFGGSVRRCCWVGLSLWPRVRSFTPYDKQKPGTLPGLFMSRFALRVAEWVAMRVAETVAVWSWRHAMWATSLAIPFSSDSLFPQEHHHCLATCHISRSTGVARPKMLTATLMRVSGSNSSIATSKPRSTMPGN